MGNQLTAVKSVEEESFLLKKEEDSLENIDMNRDDVPKDMNSTSPLLRGINNKCVSWNSSSNDVKIPFSKNNVTEETFLPYIMVMEHRLCFDDPDFKGWISNCPVHLAISIFYFNNKCWYTINLEHGCFSWSVSHCVRDFLELHLQLQAFRTYIAIQMPEIRFGRDQEQRRSSIVVVRKEVPKVPNFYHFVKVAGENEIGLENYMQRILQIPCFRNYYKTLQFLEIGPFSFIKELGPKMKEGFVRRRSNCGDTALGICCTMTCGFWKKRWLFLKENFLGLIDPSQGDLECVMLLDHAFQIKRDKKRNHRGTLIVQNLCRQLILQCESDHHAHQWSIEIDLVLCGEALDFIDPNRHDSFAPPRLCTECKWIIDGATYFDAVAVTIEAAKEEIFITGWWLSPEIYLRRPTTHGHYWQLDYLLRRKAREGVKIYVLLYKELEIALGINSLHTEQKLSKMHPNIQVLRHPYISKGVILWAHHEKIVCVDQTYAFIGGLDLCYGRWDDFQHRLTDLGELEEKLKVRRHMSTCKQSLEEQVQAKTSRSASSLLHLAENTEIYKEQSSEDTEVALTNALKNIKLKKVLRKYQATKVFERIKRQLSTEELGQQQTKNKIFLFPEQPADQHRAVQEIALVHLGLERQFRLWHGKDYVNFISKDFEELHQPYSDMINRNSTPRMPWHDVGLYCQGKAARDIARHFILRWNHAKDEICPNDPSKPYLMPKCYSVFHEISSNPELLQAIGSLYRAECQVLRSLCFWSGNVSHTESSIHKAYLNVIRESKKFIYIENQFFISQPQSNSYVYNGVADALFNRILKAHREHKDFYVYVVLPLLPAFEGEVGTGTGILIQAVTHWNYKSICRGPNSLLVRLAMHMKDPSKYIGFYGLRTHGTLGDKLVTELVYVHSKLLVADDQVAIIGSANINDRSLIGRRDSEIAILIRDTHFLEEYNKAGQFCYSLRTALFKEHLGLMQKKNPSIDLSDPSKFEFYDNIWNNIAANNTKIYEEVFSCLPTNNVTSFVDLQNYQQLKKLASTDPYLAKEKLKKVEGHLVFFPLSFLCDVNLLPQYTTKERFLPYSIFT